MEIDNSDAPEWLKKLQKLPYTERILAECLQVRIRGQIVGHVGFAGSSGRSCTAAGALRRLARPARSLSLRLTAQFPPTVCSCSCSSCPPSAPAAWTLRAPRATSTEQLVSCG